MEFNPWALVVFLLAGMYLYGSGLSNTPVATIFFLTLAPVWLLCGYLWDKFTIKEDKDWVCPIERSDWYPVD
jgi:uncharacterized membrane protein YciS (DUF1049 family)